MKIGYIIAGMVFLFNPFISIYDFLPDVIGYALIVHGLSKLYDLERNLSNAREKFLKLAWLSAVKFAMLALVPIFDATLYLIFTFSFGVMELIWMIPAFLDLFYGVSFLESRHTDHRTRHVAGQKPMYGGTFDKTDFEDGRVFFELYEKPKKGDDFADMDVPVYFEGGKDTVSIAYSGIASKDTKKMPYFYESDEARVMSMIFIIVRTLSAVLPEITAILGTGDSYVHADYGNDYSALHDMLVVIFAGISLLVGTIWLVRMIRYFNAFRKDTAFINTLTEKYETEIVPDKPLWVKRRLLRFCMHSTFAILFLFCISMGFGDVKGIGLLEKVYIVPEFVFGILMIFAFRAASPYDDKWKSGVQKSVAFLVLSLLAGGILFVTSAKYGWVLYPFKEAEYRYLFFAYLAIFAATMLLLILICHDKRRVYRQFVLQIATVISPDDREYAVKKRSQMQDEYKKKINGLYRFGIFYAVFSILCMAVIPFGEDRILFGLSWMFRSAAALVLIIKSLILTDKLQYEIEKVSG